MNLFTAHGQLFCSYHLLCSHEPIPSYSTLLDTNDSAYLHSFIARELAIPLSEWPRVLSVLNIPDSNNFHSSYDRYEELIKLFQRKHLRAARIPQLTSLPAFHEKNDRGYCFTRGPDRFPVIQSPQTFSSVEDAKAFLQSLNINESNIGSAWHGNPPLAQLMEWKHDALNLFAQGLVNSDIFAYSVPAYPPAPTAKAVEYLPASNVDREIPATPVAPVTPTKPSALSAEKSVPPSSLADCEQRLIRARDVLNTEGYTRKYTDEQQLQKVAEGSVSQERFLVSFQTKNTDPDAKLAFRRNSGLVPVWATSFDQLENADTDPQLIADILGTPYDPSKDYVLHIIDRGETFNQFGQNTLVPTWANMQEPVQKYLGGKHDPNVLAEVMTPEYQTEYAEHIANYHSMGLKEFDNNDQREYSETLASEERPAFLARHNVRTEIGANSEFTGNGLTQSREGSTQYGVVETLTLENNPPPIIKMVNVKTINLTPRKVG